MHKKQSLFQISKRDTLPLSKALLIRGGILLLALIFCGLITTILTGKNPLSVYATIPIRRIWHLPPHRRDLP